MTLPRRMPEWAYNQMIEGLQKLLVLRLSGAPPADTVTALAAVWEEALTPYTWYYDKGTDGRRLPQAFAAVVQSADKWVQPAHVIAALPRNRCAAAGAKAACTVRRGAARPPRRHRPNAGRAAAIHRHAPKTQPFLTDEETL